MKFTVYNHITGNKINFEAPSEEIALVKANKLVNGQEAMVRVWMYGNEKSQAIVTLINEGCRACKSVHFIELSNDEYHYISELLANRAKTINKLSGFDPKNPSRSSDSLLNEACLIESLISDKFISI